jgi:hypothetical protein
LNTPGHPTLETLLPYHVEGYRPPSGPFETSGRHCIMQTGPFAQSIEKPPDERSAHAALARAANQRYLVCKPNAGSGGSGPGAWASTTLPLAGAYTGRSTTPECEGSTIVPKVAPAHGERVQRQLNVTPGLTAQLAERWNASEICPADGLWLYACSMLAGAWTDDSHLEPSERPIPLTATGWLAVEAMQLGRFLEGSVRVRLPRGPRWLQVPTGPPPWPKPRYDFDTGRVHLGREAVLGGIPPDTWRLRLGRTRAIGTWFETHTSSADALLAGNAKAQEETLRTMREAILFSAFVAQAKKLREKVEAGPCLAWSAKQAG